MSDTLTEQLAGYWASAPFEHLPDNVVHAAKRALLDTLGAGIAGSRTEEGQIILRAMAPYRGAVSASGAVWGDAVVLPPAQAALVNGTMSHVLELDDYAGCGHSGAVVVPATLALAAEAGATGRQILMAIVAGYDVAARVLDAAGGYDAHNQVGWHSTGTCGSFGAAAAAARLLGLELSAFADSLGIAGSFTGGLWAFLADGAMTKRLHPGKAAETGVTAALLAKAGMTGPHKILEADWGGFLSTYVPGLGASELTTAQLGRTFKILESGMKPYACCRSIHGSIDGLLDVMASATLMSRDIAKVVVHGDQQTRRQFARRDVRTRLDAQFSMPYCLAVTATSGHATFDRFAPLRTADPEVQRLIEATDIAADRQMKSYVDTELEVVTVDGRRFTRMVPFPKGAPENPVSDAELLEKFFGLTQPIIGERQARALADAVLTLDDASGSAGAAKILSLAAVVAVAQ